MKIAIFLQKYSSLLIVIDQTNKVCSYDDQGRVYRNCKFPLGAEILVLGRGHISHMVKLHFIFNNLLLYTQAYIRQTKFVLVMTKEGFTKIVNFMFPGAGVLVQRRGHISHIVKIAVFL